MPKVILLLFFALNFTASATAQIAVELSKMNVLYPCFENPMTVVVNNVPDSNLFLIPSIGKIRKYGRAQYYWQISTDDAGFAYLTLRDTVKNEFLGKYQFRVGVLPEPIAMFGAQHRSKKMGNGEFCAQAGIAMVWHFFDIDARCEMEKFEVVYIAKGQNLVVMENTGARFSGGVRDLINKAKPGDAYIFRRFVYQMPCFPGLRYSAQELYFTIK